MRYAVEIKPSAVKDLRALPKDVQRRVARKIDGLADNPRPPGVKKLEGLDNVYRLRVGDYRIIYQVQDDRVIVLVLRVRHRKDAYRQVSRHR